MTGKKRVLGSDLKKVDRHVIQPHEYDEVPELTDDMFERGDLCWAAEPSRRRSLCRDRKLDSYWLMQRPRPKLKEAIRNLTRCNISTAEPLALTDRPRREGPGSALAVLACRG